MQLIPMQPLLGFFLIGGIIGLITTIFWLWMIVDCILNSARVGTQKIVWLLVGSLLHFIGALLYFFLARGSRTGAGI